MGTNPSNDKQRENGFPCCCCCSFARPQSEIKRYHITLVNTRLGYSFGYHHTHIFRKSPPVCVNQPFRVSKIPTVLFRPFCALPGVIVFLMNARAKGGGYRWGGGAGVIGQPFVQFCVRRFAPSVVCSVFPVSAYFPLMDTSLQQKRKGYRRSNWQQSILKLWTPRFAAPSLCTALSLKLGEKGWAIGPRMTENN